MSTEAWLNGPIEGVPPLLMPVAHSLVQAKADLRNAARGISHEQLWQRPGGAASLGFHLRHIPGTADRLLTYAMDRQLDEEQLAALRGEKDGTGTDVTAAELLDRIDEALDLVLAHVRSTSQDDLTAVRHVGRARIPSTVIGLLFHIAEHTQRHTGQVITTAKIIAAGA